MFSVHHSNSLDILKDALISLIKQHPLKHPFDKEIVLVQSPGMAQWLQMEIAKAQGVVANIEFPLPATFIWDSFNRVLTDVPKRSFFNKEAMMWKLMKILPRQLDDPDFSELKQYLQDDPLQVKRFQLAGKIADIYDQYLLYRPDWINAWEAEKNIDELADASIWQSKLWRELYEHTLAQEQSPYHRANLYERFIDTLQFHQHKPIGLNKIQRVLSLEFPLYRRTIWKSSKRWGIT